MARKFAPSLNIYRGNKTKTGHASRFSLSRNPEGKVYLWLEMAKQVGENANGRAIFSWRGSKQAVDDGSVTVRLDDVDIGEFLTVITGRKDHAGSDTEKTKGLFHQTPTSKTQIEFRLYEKDNVPVSYSLSVNTQKDGKTWNRYNHLVSFGEGELLREFLLMSLREVNDWSMEGIEGHAQVEEQLPL